MTDMELLRVVHRAVRVLRLISEDIGPTERLDNGYGSWVALRLWETADELDKQLKANLPGRGKLDPSKGGVTCSNGI